MEQVHGVLGPWTLTLGCSVVHRSPSHTKTFQLLEGYSFSIAASTVHAFVLASGGPSPAQPLGQSVFPLHLTGPLKLVLLTMIYDTLTTHGRNRTNEKRHPKSLASNRTEKHYFQYLQFPNLCPSKISGQKTETNKRQ